MWALAHQIGIGINQSAFSAWARGLANIYFWLIPAMQITHLLGMSVLMGSAGLYGLRLARGFDQPGIAASAGAGLLPWIIGAALVQSLTGVFMVLHRPTRAFDSLMFLPKLALIVLGLSLFLVLLYKLKRQTSERLSVMLRLAGASLFSCWMAIALAGRLISFIRAG